MRTVRALLIYLVLVFGGGALLAPGFYWLAQSLAAQVPSLHQLASSPFHRFVDRALLGVALVGLWPLLRSCQMWHCRELGLQAQRPLTSVFFGFLLGFGSLACVALLAISLGGRAFNPAHSAAQILGHVFSAALTAIIVAILEEFLFRGALFGILRKVQPWPMALVLSSLIYALAHFIQKSESPGPVHWYSGLALLPKMFQNGPVFIPTVLTLFVAGAILALAYQRTDSLFFSMGLHAGWIFWLKSYGFFTMNAPGAHPAVWGTEKLIDGWLALPILLGVFVIVCNLKMPNEREHGH